MLTVEEYEPNEVNLVKKNLITRHSIFLWEIQKTFHKMTKNEHKNTLGDSCENY